MENCTLKMDSWIMMAFVHSRIESGIILKSQYQFCPKWNLEGIPGHCVVRYTHLLYVRKGISDLTKWIPNCVMKQVDQCLNILSMQSIHGINYLFSHWVKSVSSHFKYRMRFLRLFHFQAVVNSPNWYFSIFWTSQEWYLFRWLNSGF